MANVLTISGQKGGTGKSVTAVNLAACLALYEKKVLLIDCDPQGCSTAWAGRDDVGSGYDMASVFKAKTQFLDAVMKTEPEGLDILPAGFSLFDTALKLSDSLSNQRILRLLIQEDARSRYDYIIIDAPSSYGFLSIMALTAADWLIIPVCPDHTLTQEFHCLLKLIHYIRKNHKIPLKIGGFVLNRRHFQDDFQSGLTTENMRLITDLAYDTCIPQDAAVQKSIEKKTPLVLYDIKSPAGAAFLSLAKEIDVKFT